ncbi:MAG: T9SS type A sorting domain-containing protein [Bacteroidia bacterium]
MKKLVLLIIAFNFTNTVFAQRVYSLVPGIVVDSILKTKPNATKIAKDPISGHLFYATSGGNIYEVFIPTSGSSTDSLRYTSAQHGITTLQGLCFKDSIMFLCGNQWSTTTGIGMVVKGTLHSNNLRTWVNIATTAPYPTADINGDHGFAGVNIDPAKQHIYVSSGARTHLGEIRTNGGAWPNCREVPATTRIYKFPIDTTGVLLPNDSTLIDNSGFVFAYGTRNAYDMGWDGNNNLFAIDNSGERDDPEELNWLRYGKNYGYPWRMGNDYNPLIHSPYNVNNDVLVNHLSEGYQSGWFANDPTFPQIPNGTIFTDPVLNYGPDADFYRDSINGKVKNASDEGTFISSFTPHRSPLGLVFDKDSLLPTPYRGDALILSFMPGGDSTGYTPLSPWGGPCPFVDPVRDLLHLKLIYNAALDNYTMTATKIMFGFYLPVDAELVKDTLYVIENGGDIWRIIFPLYSGVQKNKNESSLVLYPNPASNNLQIKSNEKTIQIQVIDMFGIEILTTKENSIDISNLQEGIYFVNVKTNEGSLTKKIIVQR